MELSNLLVKLSIACFAISLILPVTCCGFGGQDIYGFLVLLMGWIGLFGLEGLAWVGNLLIVISWIVFYVKKDVRLSMVLSTLSTLLGVHGIFINTYDDPLYVGAYVWLLSLVIASVAFTIALVQNKERKY